jgi:hypothetical protein
MSIVVFSGPTLPAAEASQTLAATYLGPARRGDLFRAAGERPRAIGLVDGYFEHSLAVWHKEILWALSHGVRVYGAASLGALRAAELEAFGMVGVGNVFARYRSGELEDDDEVALVHGPASHGYARASEAMVNIRATLARACEQGVISAAIAAALVRRTKALFYPDRTVAALIHAATELGLTTLEVAALERWWARERVDVKRADAIAMLERMAADASEPAAPITPSFHFEHTEAWEEFLRQQGAGFALQRARRARG